MERYKEGMTMLIVNCSVVLFVGCQLLVGFWLFCWLFVRLVGWLVGWLVVRGRLGYIEGRMPIVNCLVGFWLFCWLLDGCWLFDC